MPLVDKYEHDVPIHDYDHATERYPPDDPRYALAEAYCRLVEERRGIEVYNCKITTRDNYYNVYLHLRDAQRDLGENWNSPMWNSKDRRPYTRLFHQALARHPVAELEDKTINVNAVFVEDFRECSVAHTVRASSQKVADLLVDFPMVVSHKIWWNGSLYLFFTTLDELTDFHTGDTGRRFMDNLWNITKPQDQDGYFTDSNPIKVILDLQSNYNALGMQWYFNGNSMNGLAQM